MIKNYTTTVPASKSIYEIEQMLVKYGAKGIEKRFGVDGIITSLVFSIEVKDYKGTKEVEYQLPCEYKKLNKTLIDLKKKQKINIPWNKLNDYTHSINVGWRIIKDWIHAQLSLIQVELVNLDQVFLPYAYNQTTGMTLYETYKEGLLLGEEK